MKKTSFLAGSLITVLLFGGLSLTADAQTSAGKSNETAQTKIQNLGAKVKTRLTAALERADNLRTRVAERVTRFAEPKFDVAAVNQKLTEAAAVIDAGRQKLATIDAAIAKAAAAADKAATVAVFRQTMRDLAASVRAAHQKIVEAIRLIRSAYPLPATVTPPTPAATTTD